MTSFDPSPLEALSGLLEERRRFEGWLAQLESRRGDSPGHVVDRVRGDYLSRLESVTQQLRGRASDLEASAAGLRERIASLESEESTRRDERYEMELRSLVGEFEPEHAQRSMAICDDDIARLSTERETHSQELAKVSEVLASVAPPVAPEPEPEVVMRERVPEAAERPMGVTLEGAAPVTEHASALETSSLSSASNASQLDELAFLHSVVESQDASTTAQADMLPPPVLTAPRRPVTPLSTSIPSIQSTPNPFASTTSTLTPGSMPSYFKDMPTEQVKTLKCQECGTMNYPTEWYCERCGGELAAM